MKAATPEPVINLAVLEKHRDELKKGLALSQQELIEAKEKVVRMTGAVAGIDVLITQLTTPAAPAKPAGAPSQ